MENNASVDNSVKSMPLIEWMRSQFTLEFKSIQDFVKRKLIKVNDVLIRNPSYAVKEGDILFFNGKRYLVTFKAPVPKKDTK